jgi:hypothetical protein
MFLEMRDKLKPDWWTYYDEEVVRRLSETWLEHKEMEIAKAGKMQIDDDCGLAEIDNEESETTDA